MTEFNIEGNNIVELPDGLLNSLSRVNVINMSRNEFQAFPQGGPAQFTSASVRDILGIGNQILFSESGIWMYSGNQIQRQFDIYSINF